MKKFMDKDFLLENEVSKVLYHNYASKVPVFDYHCHLVPMEIATDHEFKNITEMWLYHDHYKWRAMRSFGIDEKYITGDASDYDKFYQFAKMNQLSLEKRYQEKKNLMHGLVRCHI